MQKMIFVVDDSSTNLAVAEVALEQLYRVMTLPSAASMFAMLKKITPDLILLDIEMPDTNGFEALKQLKSNNLYSSIPVIFLTNMSDANNEAYGIELGAVDFISKPFSKPVLLNRIKHHLHIEDIIKERTDHLMKLQNGIVFIMADIIENRDKDTGGHVDRMTEYTKLLIDAMIEQKIYSNELNDWDLDSFVSSVRLHDVGKVLIPDSILNKPGPLTGEEYEVMKTHPSEGKRIIDKIISRTEGAEFLRNAKLSAAYHHECWNGSGYPYKMKQTDIPLQGRIVAVVDVYDALISERPYKKPFTETEAIEIIREDVGKRFDPHIANMFINIRDQLKAAHLRITQRTSFSTA
jgi:putative two-component system response regulator